MQAVEIARAIISNNYSVDELNNIADAINKIGFGLVVYSVASAESAKISEAKAA